ncbi:Ubiquitin--protein ligase [Bertholletia excelsa]
MAKFCVGRENGIEGPSSPGGPKRQRITFTRPQQLQPLSPYQQQTQPQPQPQPQTQPQPQPHPQPQSQSQSQTRPQYQYQDPHQQPHRLPNGREPINIEEREEDEEESASDEDEDEEISSEEEEDDDDEDEGEDDRNQASRTVTAPIPNIVPCRDNRASAGSHEERSISVTLTNPDVLDCPVCAEPLKIPVFQCDNGHLSCSSCSLKLRNKCPTCYWPIGCNRCWPIEKVIESVKVPCPNMSYGCKEMVSYSKKLDHAALCKYAGCACPIQDCGFGGSSHQLFMHFSSKHQEAAGRFGYNCPFPIVLEVRQKYLILVEQSDGVIFILNNRVDAYGNMVDVISIGPSSSKRGFSYDLVARSGATSLKLQSVTEMMPSWSPDPPLKKFLLVPSDFVGSGGLLRLELCIWRRRDFPSN